MFVAVRASAPVAGDPAEDWREHVPDPERDQLRVRVVLRVRHPVRDDSRKQGLDSAQHRDGEGGREEVAHEREGQPAWSPRERWGGQDGGIPATSRPCTVVWKRLPMVATLNAG